MELLVLLITCSFLLPYVHSQLEFPNIKFEFPNIKFENYNPKDLLENPGYGKSWMYFPDGNGIPIVAFLEFNNLTRTFYTPIENFVSFHLYTRLNPTDSQIIELGNKSSLINSTINISKPTKFVIHGWTSNYLTDTSQTIKNNLLQADDFNIILVNWEGIASNVFYPIPVMKTNDVGDFIGRIVDFLVENGANLDDVHLIGHSLGAHIAGRAGRSVKSGKVGRVTGLDPALPGFEFIALNHNKLDKSDGKFVDVIHTCGGVLGYYSKLGHADFYPNGGIPSQPGCFGIPQLIESCSHGRAWQYFAESIKSADEFMGTKCDSWEKYKEGNCDNNIKMPMGLATPNSAEGVYYLRTKPSFIATLIYDVVNTTHAEVTKLFPLLG